MKNFKLRIFTYNPKLMFLGISIIFGLLSCKKAAIQGKVVDPFQNPINNVKVTIMGSTFSDITNSNGEYSIEFAPGADINISFTKKDFANASLKFIISTESRFPAATLVMYPSPSEEGLYYLTKESYRPMIKAKYLDHFEGSGEYGYYSGTEIFPDNFPKIKISDSLVFIDNTEGESHLWLVNEVGNRFPNWVFFDINSVRDAVIPSYTYPNNSAKFKIYSYKLKKGNYVYSSYIYRKNNIQNARIYGFSVVDN